jgi:hypothetical protein
MSELLREIEEDIRAERLHALWDRFGKTLIRVSIAVIVGTALGVAWQHYQASQAMDRTSRLMSGIEKLNAGDAKGAIVIFDSMIGDGSVHADMALLQKGQAQEAEGDHDGALKTYEILAARGSDNAFAALGKLLAAKEGDAPMAVNDKDPFAVLQNEMRAWQLLKSGKKDEAVKIFTALRDDASAPRSQRARATMALATLAPDSIEQEIK